MVWPMTTGRGAGWVRGGLCRGCAGASEDCTCVENEPGHRLIMLSGCPCHCVSFLPPSPSPSASSTGVERGSGCVPAVLILSAAITASGHGRVGHRGSGPITDATGHAIAQDDGERTHSRGFLKTSIFVSRVCGRA